MRVEHDRHINGLFGRAECVRLVREAGFDPSIVQDGFGRDLFVARWPA